jgi:hypothetical protein
MEAVSRVATVYEVFGAFIDRAFRVTENDTETWRVHIEDTGKDFDFRALANFVVGLLNGRNRHRFLFDHHLGAG